MKKSVILALCAVATMAVVADLKIATVNMVDLVKLHPSYETNRALLKSTDRDYKAKLDKQQEELKAIADEGKKAQEEMASPMLSAASKAAAQKKLEDVQRRYITARQSMETAVRHYQNELTDLESRLMKLQTDDIRKQVNVFAKENGYDMIVDNTMLAYGNEALDVTDDILRSMKIDPKKRAELKKKGDSGKKETSVTEAK